MLLTVTVTTIDPALKKKCVARFGTAIVFVSCADDDDQLSDMVCG
jgi:hypothetical protein